MDVAIAEEYRDERGETQLRLVEAGRGNVVGPFERYRSVPGQTQMFGQYINDIYRAGMSATVMREANTFIEPVHMGIGREVDAGYVLYKSINGGEGVDLYTKADLETKTQAFALVPQDAPLVLGYGWTYWRNA